MHESEKGETRGSLVPSGGNPAEKPPRPEDRIILTLYIAGQTPRSLTALANLRKLCDEYLVGRYDLEVVDLILNPKKARTDQILAVPTLVRSLPTPIARIIGDLSDTDQVLLGLNIQRKIPH